MSLDYDYSKFGLDLKAELDGRILTIRQTLFDKIIKEQVDFKEEAVKKALISLGWTPPKEDN